ncbi:LADA_0A01860g1_1 [Lachancea dasiensis]|uniref:LADA_0A01860g1_1 n=1 Tax=Lachancea dasiensis TaxID=1072105 RepID=A0A1G4IMT9_9SACH|nr:LADA_0A01860g1_1 [Lachancea dasiensis]
MEDSRVSINVEKVGSVEGAEGSGSAGKSEVIGHNCDEDMVTNVSLSRVSKKSGIKKKKKDKCYYEKCGFTALKFIGDCQFCQGHFCSRHRIMENHSCQGLKSCKEQMHQRNADKLAAEQTIVAKIQI